jgi:hypothetical protein
MILSIVVILFVLGVAFFHFVQGFFSATLSAIMAIISAALALSLQETLTEGLLAGTAPEWMPSIVLLMTFAIIYIILRTIFDKLIPGNVRMPPLLEKIGGAVMGIIAGIFAVGICVIALQQMPLGPSLAGYTRYETTDDRHVTATVQTGNSITSIRSKDAATFDELTSDHFDKEKAKTLLFPVDDMVVSTVSHLSDNGSLQAGKPLKSVHPAWLDEMFGQRLGYQFGINRTAINAQSKNKNDVSVEGVFLLPQKPDPATVADSEFKKIRSTPLTLKPLPADEMRVAVRVKLAETLADKDRLIRITPAAVRLVAHAQDELDPNGDAQPHDYYPIGTLEANGILYLNKIDDPLIIEAKGKKAAGSGEGPAVVDFVFQVKEGGFAVQADKNSLKVAPDTFIEVKKFARVDLDNKEIKPLTANVPVVAVKRKHLEWEQGPKPPEAGKIAGAAAAPEPTAVAPPAAAVPAPPAAAPAPGAAAAPAPAPAPAAAAPDANVSKLVGIWEGENDITYTFRADGTYKAAAKGGRSMDGTWKVDGVDKNHVKTSLTAKTGNVVKLEWDVEYANTVGQMIRIDGGKNIIFRRKAE